MSDHVPFEEWSAKKRAEIDCECRELATDLRALAMRHPWHPAKLARLLDMAEKLHPLAKVGEDAGDP